MFARIKGFGVVFLPLLLLILSPGLLLGETSLPGENTATLSLYIITAEKREGAKELQQALLKEAPPGEEKALWEKLWLPLPARERAALGLKLVEEIYPSRGNLGEWEKIQGFWHPTMHPRSLAALDGLFITLQALLEMEQTEAAILAQDMLRQFCTSPRARQTALREGPEIYNVLWQKLEAQNLAPPGGWPRWSGRGNLPLARPVRGSVSVDTALARKMTFLDGQGGIASGLGGYAWDREKGNIYRVIYREERIIFIPGSP